MPTPSACRACRRRERVGVGDGYSCAMVGDDAAATCGAGATTRNGELGNGTTKGSAVPVRVQGGDGRDRARGGRRARVRRPAQRRGHLCWGKGGSGQLGNGKTGDSRHRECRSTVGGYPESLAAGGFHTCALLSSPNVVCWGANDFGQLGDGTTNQEQEPTPVTGIPVRAAVVLAVAVAAGLAPRLARAQAGTAQAQFDFGLAEMEGGRYASGCPALAESYRLDPRPGRPLHAGGVREQVGEDRVGAHPLRGVHRSLRPHARRGEGAPAGTRPGRARAARRPAARRAELALALPPSAPAGTTVTRDGVPLGAPSLGVPSPVDPGEHVIVARTPDGARTRPASPWLAASTARWSSISPPPPRPSPRSRAPCPAVSGPRRRRRPLAHRRATWAGSPAASARRPRRGAVAAPSSWATSHHRLPCHPDRTCTRRAERRQPGPHVRSRSATPASPWGRGRGRGRVLLLPGRVGRRPRRAAHCRRGGAARSSG